jgi:hypothetical protein
MHYPDIHKSMGSALLAPISLNEIQFSYGLSKSGHKEWDRSPPWPPIIPTDTRHHP